VSQAEPVPSSAPKPARPATLVIAIGALRVEWGLQADGRWLGDSLSALSVAPLGSEATLSAACAALERVQSDPAPRRIHAVVADKWLALASLPWSGALRQPAAAEAFARGQLMQAGHEVQAGDLLRLDDAGFAQPRLAVAYPAPLMDALQALAARCGAGLASVLPMSAAAWAVAPHAAGVLAVLDQGQVLLAQGAGRLVEVTRREGGVAELQALWQRMQLRDPRLAGQVGPGGLPVLDLAPTPESPAQAIPGLEPVELPQPVRSMSRALQLAGLATARRLALDAVAAETAAPRWRWALAAAVLLAAGGLSAQAWQAWQRSQGLAQQLAEARERSLPPPPAPLARSEQVRVPAVNAAIRELNLPVAALLQALQPPRDIRIAVLGVDVVGAAPGANTALKISGEALTGAEMARYVAFVASRKPFTGAYLTRHEIDESTPERPFRFTVEATWND